jgi:hypothetical protein
MSRRLEQWLALEPWERRMLIALLVLLPASGVALRLWGFKRCLRLLGGVGPSAAEGTRESRSAAVDDARRIARLVDIAAYCGPCSANCLPQSLILWWLLLQRGFPAEMRIGVQRARGQLVAHAWVEYEDQPVNDVPDIAERFAAFEQPVSGSFSLR